MKTTIAEADAFAEQAHTGQVRKYTGAPYIEHPREVAELVRSVPHDEAMVCAALLHDVVEDCGVSLHEVRAKFGADVADLVGWLTDVSLPQQGNRATRKAIDRAHSANAPARAQTIKLADRISNSGTIAERDPEFARVYMREKRQLLDVLTLGDPTLREKATAIVEAWESVEHAKRAGGGAKGEG